MSYFQRNNPFVKSSILSHNNRLSRYTAFVNKVNQTPEHQKSPNQILKQSGIQNPFEKSNYDAIFNRKFYQSQNKDPFDEHKYCINTLPLSRYQAKLKLREIDTELWKRQKQKQQRFKLQHFGPEALRYNSYSTPHYSLNKTYSNQKPINTIRRQSRQESPERYKKNEQRFTPQNQYMLNTNNSQNQSYNSITKKLFSFRRPQDQYNEYEHNNIQRHLYQQFKIPNNFNKRQNQYSNNQYNQIEGAISDQLRKMSLSSGKRLSDYNNGGSIRQPFPRGNSYADEQKQGAYKKIEGTLHEQLKKSMPQIRQKQYNSYNQYELQKNIFQQVKRSIPSNPNRMNGQNLQKKQSGYFANNTDFNNSMNKYSSNGFETYKQNNEKPFNGRMFDSFHNRNSQTNNKNNNMGYGSVYQTDGFGKKNMYGSDRINQNQNQNQNFNAFNKRGPLDVMKFSSSQSSGDEYHKFNNQKESPFLRNSGLNNQPQIIKYRGIYFYKINLF